MLSKSAVYFLLLSFGLLACKSMTETAEIKDDILVRDGKSAHLYWVVGDGESQQVCRSECDMATITVEGDIQETRNSCKREGSESVDAKFFENTNELQGIYSIFFQSLSENKVAILSTDGATAKTKQSNQERVKLINGLFTDENMYLDPSARSLRDQGLMGFGQENPVRFDPRCFAADVVGSQVVIQHNETKAPILPTVKAQAVVFTPARTVEVNEIIYYSLVTFLKTQISPFQSIYKVWPDMGAGPAALWFSKSDQKPFTKVGLGSERGPALYDDKGVVASYLTAADSEAASLWANFLMAVLKIGQNQVGTEMAVTFKDGEGYFVKLTHTSGNFASPGVPKYQIFYIRGFVQSSINKFFIQIDKAEVAK